MGFLTSLWIRLQWRPEPQHVQQTLRIHHRTGYVGPSLRRHGGADWPHVDRPAGACARRRRGHDLGPPRQLLCQSPLPGRRGGLIRRGLGCICQPTVAGARATFSAAASASMAGAAEGEPLVPTDGEASASLGAALGAAAELALEAPDAPSVPV